MLAIDLLAVVSAEAGSRARLNAQLILAFYLVQKLHQYDSNTGY